MPVSYTTDNTLINPGAEDGDMTGWTSSSVTAVLGGTDGSYCFDVQTSGSMSQTWTPTVDQVPLYVNCSGNFLPEFETDPDDTEALAMAKFQVNYSDSTKDIITVPIREIEEI